MGTPAFKEWHAIVEALLAGEQILILRKGGILDRPGEAAPRERRFWLYPTRFHGQLEKTKPAAERHFGAPPASDDIVIKGWAEVAEYRFLTDWEKVSALSPLHLWSEATVRERFSWSKPPGIHVIAVRVHRLLDPIRFAPTEETAGCRTWVELPYSISDRPSTPAIGEAAFAQRLRQAEF